jgi:hypothetical protein
MATTTLPRDAAIYRRPVLSWSALFAGCFIFLAIEATFGVLGMAIFASAANPAVTHPVAGMSTGIGIWTIVLTVIALYFAGNSAARVSGVADKTSGMYHGLVTYGMSIFATVLVLAITLGSTSVNVAPGSLRTATLASTIATSGWWLFIAMVLGFIAAGIGGSNGAAADQRAVEEPTNIDRNLRAA